LPTQHLWVLPQLPQMGKITHGGENMLVQTDSRRRITLPSAAGVKPGEVVDVQILEDGRIMLVPVEAVPKHQLWAWTPEARAAVRASLDDPRPSEVVETPEQAEDVAKRWSDEG
jgi:hypothetical protein